MSEAVSNRDRDPTFKKVNDDNRAFLIQCGPIRRSIDLPQTDQGRKKYRFSKNWYNEYDWIEYSLSKDAAFCVSCRCFGTLVEYDYGICNL